MFSLLAAGLYGVVAFVAVIACSRAMIKRQAIWHIWAWALVAAIFLCFALMRVFAVEEWLRTDLRSMLYYEQFYDQRRAVQGPLISLIIIVTAAIAARLLYFVMTNVKGRRNVAVITGLGCTGALIVLATLRIISLHAVDDLLYGPLKLNWCLDIGLSLAVLACGLRYHLVVRARPG